MTDLEKQNQAIFAETQRKLMRLAEAILEFADDSLMRTEVVERCGDGPLFLANLDGVARLASDYLEQLELAQQELTQ